MTIAAHIHCTLLLCEAFMTLREIIECLKTPDHINHSEALEMEVEFNTISNSNLELISVYEYNGKIIIDIGTDDDVKKRNDSFVT